MLKKVKYIAVAITASLLTSCACAPIYTLQPAGHVARHSATSQQLVINNTRYLLTVQVDGVPYAVDVEPGQTVPIPARFYYGKTLVVVMAYQDGKYVGTDNWTFRADVPEVWQVNNVWPQHSVNRY